MLSEALWKQRVCSALCCWGFRCVQHNVADLCVKVFWRWSRGKFTLLLLAFPTCMSEMYSAGSKDFQSFCRFPWVCLHTGLSYAICATQLFSSIQDFTQRWNSCSHCHGAGSTTLSYSHFQASLIRQTLVLISLILSLLINRVLCIAASALTHKAVNSGERIIES